MMKKYHVIVLFFLWGSFPHRLAADSVTSNIKDFFGYYTAKQEKVLELEAIKRDLRSAFMYYFTLSMIFLFRETNKENATDLLKVMFLVTPFISNFCAGILQRLLSKYPSFREKSRLVQNILFSFIGASLIAFMVTIIPKNKEVVRECRK